MPSTFRKFHCCSAVLLKSQLPRQWLETVCLECVAVDVDVALADGYFVSFYCVHIVFRRVCCFRTSYPEQKWRPMENGENTILTNFDLHSVQN